MAILTPAKYACECCHEDYATESAADACLTGHIAAIGADPFQVGLCVKNDGHGTPQIDAFFRGRVRIVARFGERWALELLLEYEGEKRDWIDQRSGSRFWAHAYWQDSTQWRENKFHPQLKVVPE